MTGWIAVDLDGTLAHYDGWIADDHIGAPIAPMCERVKAWLRDGKDVRIFTARANSATAIVWINGWCVEQFGCTLPVTSQKDLGMVELWDDRCIQVETNTGKPMSQRVDEAELAHFRSMRRLEDVLTSHELWKTRAEAAETALRARGEIDTYQRGFSSVGGTS